MLFYTFWWWYGDWDIFLSRFLRYALNHFVIACHWRPIASCGWWKKTSPSPKKHLMLFSLLLWPASVQIQERGWGLALPNNMRGQHKQKENKLRHIIKVMRRGTTQREDSFLLFCVSSDFYFFLFWTLSTHHYVNELFCILKREKEESTEKKPKLLPTSSLLPPTHTERKKNDDQKS